MSAVVQNKATGIETHWLYGCDIKNAHCGSALNKLIFFLILLFVESE
jgi:hypothetical protein